MFYDLNCLLLKSFWLRRTWNQRKKTKPDFSQLYRTNCWWSIRGFVFASVRVFFSVCCYCFFFFLLRHKWRHKFLIYNYKIWYLYLLIALGFLTEFEMKRKIKKKTKRFKFIAFVNCNLFDWFIEMNKYLSDTSPRRRVLQSVRLLVRHNIIIILY